MASSAPAGYGAERPGKGRRLDHRANRPRDGFRPHRERLDLTSGRGPKVLSIRLEDPEELRLKVEPSPGKKYVNVSLIPEPEDPVQGQFFNGGDLTEDGDSQGESIMDLCGQCHTQANRIFAP